MRITIIIIINETPTLCAAVIEAVITLSHLMTPLHHPHQRHCHCLVNISLFILSSSCHTFAHFVCALRYIHPSTSYHTPLADLLFVSPSEDYKHTIHSELNAHSMLFVGTRKEIRHHTILCSNTIIIIIIQLQVLLLHHSHCRSARSSPFAAAEIALL